MEKIVKVRIQETLCKEVELKIKVDDNAERPDNDAMEVAKEKAIGMYRAGDIVLESDDFTGITEIQTECDKLTSEWDEI